MSSRDFLSDSRFACSSVPPLLLFPCDVSVSTTRIGCLISARTCAPILLLRIRTFSSGRSSRPSAAVRRSTCKDKTTFSFTMTNRANPRLSRLRTVKPRWTRTSYQFQCANLVHVGQLLLLLYLLQFRFIPDQLVLLRGVIVLSQLESDQMIRLRLR